MNEKLGQLLPPSEEDGKPVYVMSPSTEGLYTWLSTRGDDLNPTPPASGRGDGAKYYLSFDEPGEQEVEVQYGEPIELHDGHVNYDPSNWGFADEWSFLVRIPANTPVVNGTSEGNCNLVEIPGTGGTMHIIVPADGDGTHDIDLETAIVTPCGKEEDGYWTLADRWEEEITPNTEPVKGSWNMYDFSNDMFFIKRLDCGDPRGVWDLDAYKAEWISSRWKIVFRCTRVSAGAGEIGGYIMVFRPGAT